MALFLFIGYAGLCVYNIRCKSPEKRVNLLWILAIGVLVQFGWEFTLAVTGIRNPSLHTLVVNSLLETNMGLPYLYPVSYTHLDVYKRQSRMRPSIST